MDLGSPRQLRWMADTMAEIQRGIARSADRLTWVVVGDLSRVEAPVRAMGFGEATVVDSQGHRIGGRPDETR